jgi:hypothetical protein
MGIVVADADSGHGRKQGATATAIGETLSGLGHSRLNTAFFQLRNSLPDHPLVLKQARIVNAGRMLPSKPFA